MIDGSKVATASVSFTIIYKIKRTKPTWLSRTTCLLVDRFLKEDPIAFLQGSYPLVKSFEENCATRLNGSLRNALHLSRISKPETTLVPFAATRNRCTCTRATGQISIEKLAATGKFLSNVQ